MSKVVLNYIAGIRKRVEDKYSECGDASVIIGAYHDEIESLMKEVIRVGKSAQHQPTIAEFFADDDIKKMIEKTKCGVVTIASLKKFGGL